MHSILSFTTLRNSFALSAAAVVAAAAFAAPAHAAGPIKAPTGQLKALNPQPLPPVEKAGRSTLVSPIQPNVRGLSPQPLPPGGNVKAPSGR